MFIIFNILYFRARIEAEERAMDGMKQEIEKTKEVMAQKMKQELLDELARQKQQYEQSVASLESSIQAQAKAEEEKLRSEFEKKIQAEKDALMAQINSGNDSSKVKERMLQENLENERVLRNKLEAELKDLQAKRIEAAQAEQAQRKAEQAKIETDLKTQYDSELARMKSILDRYEILFFLNFMQGDLRVNWSMLKINARA